MVPQPVITPPPALSPRQTDDPYGLNSLYAQLSSLYPELYSSYSYDAGYYSSLLADYSAIYASYSSLFAASSDFVYSIPNYNPTLPAVSSATEGARLSSGVNTARPTGTSAGSSTGSEETAGSGGGLSNAAKIGIGVGVPLAVAFLVGIGIFLWCAGKRKGRKTSTTIVAPQTQQPQFQPGYVNSQGYMPGFQPTPPPQYVQPQPGGQYAGYGSAAAGYKEPTPGVVELEQEYHFARPGVVEMGESESVPMQQGKKEKKK